MGKGSRKREEDVIDVTFETVHAIEHQDEEPA